MDLPGYEACVRESLEAAREALGRIEIMVREEGERPELMACSRIFAQFCMYVREYLSGVHARKPLPRRFAQRIAPLRAELDTYAAALAAHDLRPSPQDLDELIRAVEDLPGTA